MKKLLAVLLAVMILTGLYACGRTYTAVPELGLSWDMSLEQVQSESRIKLDRHEHMDGTSLSSTPGDKHPKVFGFPLSWYLCFFDSYGKLSFIELHCNPEQGQVMNGYDIAVDAVAKEYGSPTIQIRREARDPNSKPRSIWKLDSGWIVVRGASVGNMLETISFLSSDYDYSD